MPIDLRAHHPAYDERLPDWVVIEDCFAGERTVKGKGDTYLPPTGGMRENGYGTVGDLGQTDYDAYKLRARFPGFVRKAVTGLAGVIHRKPPVVKVPTALEPMVKRMTLAGESLEMLWQRMTETQLLEEHGGLLLDVPDGASVANSTPYVVLYKAPQIPNWDDSARDAEGRAALGLVVLDETTTERTPELTWECIVRYRLVVLSSIAVELGLAGAATDTERPVYQTATAERSASSKSTDLILDALITPAIGSRPLEQIPFVYFGSVDMTPTPGTPPLLDLANLSLTIYRADADYRHTLYEQSQSSLVLKGGGDDDEASSSGTVKTGVGAVIRVAADGDAKFIGVEAAGLSEQRESLENDKREAATHVIQLLDAGGGKDAESGEALRIRVSARTATINTMQTTAAAALREILVIAGRWLALAESELAKIEVTPNLDFSDAGGDLKTVSVLLEAKLAGGPVPWRVIHGWLQKHELTDRTFEEDREEAAVERVDNPSGRAGLDIDPRGAAA